MKFSVFAFVAQYSSVAFAGITAETGSVLQTKSSFSVAGLGASEQVTNDHTKSVGNDDAAASSLSTFPSGPGCWVLTPSGCPRKKHEFSANSWKLDAISSSDQNACLVTRKKQYDDYCGATDTQMIWYQAPSAPGCWVLTPSGCPRKKHEFSANSWKRDDHGEEHYNAASDENACLVTRKEAFDHYCGATDTQMIWYQAPSEPGCWVLTPSASSCGTKNAPGPAPNFWKRDDWGESNYNAASDQNACLVTRQKAYDDFCHVTDSQMIWNRPPTTSPTTTAPTAPTTTAPTTTAGVMDIIVKATSQTNFNKDLQAMKNSEITSSTYLAVDKLEKPQNYKVGDEYIFKLTFKGRGAKGERTVTMQWAQTSWLTASGPSGFRGIEITTNSDSDGPVQWGKFNGLRSCGELAVFCSTTGWWAAVGQYKLGNWKSGQQLEDGIPAWPVNKFSADSAELQCRVAATK